MQPNFATLGINHQSTLVFEDCVATYRCDDAAELSGFLDRLQEHATQPVTFAISYEGSGAQVTGIPHTGLVAQACVWDRKRVVSQQALLNELPLEHVQLDFQIQQGFEDYQTGFERVIEYIRSGDCYQANLTVSGHGQFTGSVAGLYRHLLQRQWVPYHALMPWAEGHAISLSPELLWKVNGDLIQCEPMKGTVESPEDTEKAAMLGQWLANDAKNRAENVMIVDLIRNDLSRIAQSGSVSVPIAFEVRRYATVQQMVSRVQAQLATQRLADWVSALVPFGSITGAPKRRSMEILSTLEGRSRGLYTGAMGYLHNDESLCNVAIRTVSTQGQQFEFGVGGGLTIGSNLEDEWQEAMLKTKFLQP